jgi:uncharacterized membrane protein
MKLKQLIPRKYSMEASLYGVFFISFNLILLVSGIHGLTISETTAQYITFSSLTLLSIILFIIMVVYYRKRSNKRTNETWCDCGDCFMYGPDCMPNLLKGKKGFDCDGFDCDCSPDCSLP